MEKIGKVVFRGFWKILNVLSFFFFFLFLEQDGRMDFEELACTSRLSVDFGSDIVGFWGGVFRVFDVIFSNWFEENKNKQT